MNLQPRKKLKSLHKLDKKVTGDDWTVLLQYFRQCFHDLRKRIIQSEMQQERNIESTGYCIGSFRSARMWRVVGTLGHADSVCDAKWPAYNEEYLVEDTINYTISFNGKARFNMEFPADETSEAIQSTVLADERSAKWMEGKSVVKVIVVPKKIVNIVIK